jgi:hypothetical protein
LLSKVEKHLGEAGPRVYFPENRFERRKKGLFLTAGLNKFF